MRKGGASVPPYLQRHSGTVLICGSAWCLDDDYERAKAIRPDATVIAINRTICKIPATIMVAIDRLNAQAWKENACCEGVTLHGGRFGARGGPEAYPWFDHWWPDHQRGGTSVQLAASIALVMGFDEAILCGAPLTQGPYFDGNDDWSDRTPETMEKYRDPWRQHEDLHPFVRSMSGWTKTFLGSPT